MINEYFFDDKASLFAALFEQCAQILTSSITEKQVATMLVSGGSTPLPLYQKLSELELPWDKVDVALVDERWVEHNHPASNEAFIKDNLLQHKASSANFVAMKTTAETASLGLVACEQAYQNLRRPFDLTILGMGVDGHTASLFPMATGLQHALDSNNTELCAAITATPSEVTGDFIERMTLTFNGLMQSRQLYLLITGAEKLAVYKQALASPDRLLMPISAILHQQKVPVCVYWAP